MHRFAAVSLMVGLVLLSAAPVRAQNSDDKQELRKELIRKLDRRLRALRKEMIQEIDKRLGAKAPRRGPTARPTGDDVPRPFMGIALKPVSRGMRTLLGIPDGQGVMVDDVIPGSSADKAGLRRTDVIVGWNGRTIAGKDALVARIRGAKVGDVAKLTVIRRGRKLTVECPMLARGAAAAPGTARPGQKRPEGALDSFLDRALRSSRQPKGTQPKGTPKPGPGGMGMGNPEQMQKMMEQFFGGQGNGDMQKMMQQAMKQYQEMMKNPEQRKRMQEMMKRMFGQGAPGGGGEDMQKMLERMMNPGGQKNPGTQPKSPKDPKKSGDQKRINKMLDDLLGEGTKTPKKDTPKKPAPKRSGRAFLGVGLTPVAPVMRQQLKLKDGEGVLVENVVEGSPAAKAGLKRHDVLVRVGKTMVGDMAAIRATLGGRKPGDKLTLTVVRGGKRLELNVELGTYEPKGFK